MTIAPEISENQGDDWVSGGSIYLPENQIVVETYSTAKPANEILHECGAPVKIGLFSIDVEGAELEVLKGIDFKKYSFGIVLLETAVDSPSNKLLEHNGYFFYRHIGQNRIFLNNKYKMLKNFSNNFSI